MKIYLVSSCLFGLKTRYDGKVISPGNTFRHAVAGTVYIPVCPEQLGGLPTPRAADIIEGDGYDVLAGRSRVVCRNGDDVTENFILGANQVLQIARKLKVSRIILKAGSPSCGFHPKTGVTAALLQSEGFEVVELD